MIKICLLLIISTVISFGVEKKDNINSLTISLCNDKKYERAKVYNKTMKLKNENKLILIPRIRCKGITHFSIDNDRFVMRVSECEELYFFRRNKSKINYIVFLNKKDFFSYQDRLKTYEILVFNSVAQSRYQEDISILY